MSKRSFIIAAMAVILFIAAIFSVVNDFKPKSESETEPEAEPGTEKFTGPRKGFYWDRVNKVYKPAKVKEGKQPYQGTASNEIVEPDASAEVKKDIN
jgi:hypothetical protein